MRDRRALTGARRIFVRALDVILPPRCLGCGDLVQQGGSLCPTCWAGLTFIGAPHCAACGLPFGYGVGEDALCGGCLRRRPSFDHVRSALLYDDASRRLIIAFKHGDKTELAHLLAAWVARVIAPLGPPDMIIPVPLHERRLWRRRYNQSSLIARGLAPALGAPVNDRVLTRHRATETQGGLTRRARWTNVRGAFRVRPSEAPRLRGAHVLVVDDVLTTGATIESCARALRRAGAARIDVATVARVVIPHGDVI